MVKNIVKRQLKLESKSIKIISNKKNNNKTVIETVSNNIENMDNIDLQKANNIIDSVNKTNNVKKIKKESGLIERIDNKVILTEDNKMLLKD